MKIKNTIFGLTVAAILAGGCSFLDPLPDGSYNDENFGDYPELLRGFVDKAYADYFPAVYYSTYCAGLAAATDDALYRSETAMWRSFSKGNARMGNDTKFTPFTTRPSFTSRQGITRFVSMAYRLSRPQALRSERMRPRKARVR